MFNLLRAKEKYLEEACKAERSLYCSEKCVNLKKSQSTWLV